MSDQGCRSGWPPRRASRINPAERRILDKTLVQNCRELAHQVEIGRFRLASHVVGLTSAALKQDLFDRAAMVMDMEPVAHLKAIAIDGERLALEDVQDDERNQLLRVLVGAVIVRAV